MRPQFPKVPSYLKSFCLGVGDFKEKELPQLERYVREGCFEFCDLPEFGPDQYNIFNARGDLIRVTNALRWHAIHRALSNEEEWLGPWVRSAGYAYWATRIEIRNQQWILEQYQSGKRPQYHRSVNFHRYVFAVGNCLVLGWKEWAVDLAQRANWALDNEGFNDADDSAHRRTQHFVLRLIGDEQGWPTHIFPSCAFDEPIFNTLIEKWRDPNPAELSVPLLAACDRHTHQARINSNKACYDLPWMDEWYVPFEILSVLKLRELHGLPNPELDHPLMNTPLGRLPSPQPPYSDELLEGVLARAREEFADF
jgi:hypothetical protein